MGFSPINNYSYNHGNNFKSGTSSRSFNDGTEELLRNVLGGPSFYDYKSQDGDSLSLSPFSKKQLTQEDFLAIAQQFQDAKNDPPESRAPVIPQAVRDFFIKYAAGSGEKVHDNPVTEAPDFVKNFFQTHTPSDLRNMSLDQIPDDVKEFVKMQTASPNGSSGMPQSYHGINGIHTVNPDDMARKLVNSLFVNATSQDVNSNGNSQSSYICDADLFKKVNESLDRIFEGLNMNSADLPVEVKGDLNSVYIQAQHKIDQWATANGIKTAGKKNKGLVF